MKKWILSPQSLRRGMGSAAMFNIVGKGVGYGRQLLMAYYFGISRGVDIYYMAFCIATLTVFPVTPLFEQLAVPFLIRRQEEGDADAARSAAASLFTFSCLLSLAVGAAFVLLLPVLIPLVARGFSVQDRSALRSMALSFLPWIALSFPSLALGSILKSRRLYGAVLVGDFLVSLGALASFILWHTSPAVLPLAMGVGAFSAFLWFVLVSRGRTPFWGPILSRDMKPLYRSFAAFFSVNQFSSVSSVADRFFQSYLRPGAVAAVGYAFSTLGPINDFVLFEEFYIVPLSRSEGRSEKLERLITGLILVNVPLAVFLSTHARSIIGLLYQRGHFDEGARTLTAQVFSLWSVILISSALGAPVARMFQIVDRVRYTGINTLLTALISCALNYVFVFRCGWDVWGYTSALALTSFLSLIPQFILITRSGLVLRFRSLFRYFAFASGVSLLATLAVWALPHARPIAVDLGLRAAAFAVLVAGPYLLILRRIMRVLYGTPEPA